MFWVIFSGIATVAMLLWEGIIIGGFIFIPEDMRGSFHRSDILPIAVYVISTLMMGGLFCFTLSEYVASNIGYNSAEYRIKKKISITEEEDTIKVDTTYFLVKINN